MKRMFKLAIIASFSIAVGVAALFHGAPSAVVSSQTLKPRTLYLQNCARCHGANGKAQTALGKKLEADDLTASDASTAKIIRTITNGRGDMPSFKKRLTKEQIASIAGYVKAL